MTATVPTINAPIQPTSTAWLEQALANMDEILRDRSHCERKPASARN